MAIAPTTILKCTNTLMTLTTTTTRSQKTNTGTITEPSTGLGITSMGIRRSATMSSWMTMTMTCGDRISIHLLLFF